jgi:signal transduction histidine kinase
MDSYANAEGELAAIMRGYGVRAVVAAPIFLVGGLWGAVIVSVMEPGEAFPEGAEQRIAYFAELAAQALANASAREELAASRARIVQAGDEERRRLERNLHDGAQQRLVSLALMLRLAARRHPEDDALEQAGDELSQALQELRELARGIHPAVLTERGLEPAVRAVADRAPLPVELAVDFTERLPGPAEAAAYYVVSEALTNVAKYAEATLVTVNITRTGNGARIEVIDDGVGGANTDQGSGLRGLADRVEALGGRLAIDSPRGVGTTLRADIPV